MAFVTGVWFRSGASGSSDFTDGAAEGGFLNLADGGCVNGKLYSYKAVSDDKSQWEYGEGAYNSGTGLIARTTIRKSSNANAKVTFSAAPKVLLGPHAPDLVGQQTIWIPAGAMVPRATNGAAAGLMEAATNDVMSAYLAFDATTSEAAQFFTQLPKGWNLGTIITQFIWTHPATTTNFGVRWGIRAVSFANDDALDSAFGTEQEVADTGGTTSDVYITAETGALTIAGSPAAEEFQVWEVYRDPADAADTMAVDAYLLGVKLHYTTDTPVDD